MNLTRLAEVCANGCECNAFFPNVQITADVSMLEVLALYYNGFAALLMLFGYVFWPIERIWQAFWYPIDAGSVRFFLYDLGQGEHFGPMYYPLSEYERMACLFKYWHFIQIGTMGVTCLVFTGFVTVIAARWLIAKRTESVPDENKMPLLGPEERPLLEHQITEFLQFVNGIVQLTRFL
jgi:hypothetical protein